MTALRRRMIEDMQAAGLSAGTQRCYAAAVAQLAQEHGRSPDRITEEEVRRYALRLRDVRGAARGTFETHWYGMRFFYLSTLGVEWGLFLKKKCGCRSRSVFPWRAAMRRVVGCCRA